jgi:hypothetical protein
MPVIPEKRSLESRVQGALGAQFWGQPVQSARVIAGITTIVPCEPPPLPLCAPSGLSRTQLLVAAHAAGVPLFPGWCEEHGGVVRGDLGRKGAGLVGRSRHGASAPGHGGWMNDCRCLDPTAVLISALPLPKKPPSLLAPTDAGSRPAAVGAAALVGCAHGAPQGPADDRAAQHADTRKDNVAGCQGMFAGCLGR